MASSTVENPVHDAHDLSDHEREHDNQSQTYRSPHRSRSPPVRTRSPSIEEINHGAHVNEQCDQVVQDFRAGELPKGKAILQIVKILNENPKATPDSVGKAVESYARILENFEAFKERAGGHGHRDGGEGGRALGDSGVDTGGVQGDGGTGRKQDVGGAEDDAGAQYKRKRSESPDSSGEDSGRRLRLDVSKLPFISDTSITLRPDLEKTRLILENIARDPKQTKSIVQNHAGCPQFPSGLWTGLLAGEYVDLDRVFSGIYATSAEEGRKERIGSVELTVGAPTPAKHISSLGDWVIAWGSYQRAVEFVFPHRSRELTAYADTIRQLFAAFPTGKQQSVINFDKAVRLRVSQTRQHLLTDRFVDLETIWLINSGAAAVGGGPLQEREPPKRKMPRREACKRWNENRCPNGANSCSYAHICAKCRNTGHTQAQCEQGPARK
jgi:hypothetical protein